MEKNFFPFFLILIFIVTLVLGCSSFGGGGLAETTRSAHFAKGILNSTIVINGKETTGLSLTSRQPAEIGIYLKNSGPNDITNLNIRAIGCVEFDSPNINGLNSLAVLSKDETNYLSWSVKAPELGSGESFTCPLIFRACFEETSHGYMDVTILPQDYSDAPAESNFYYKSGIFQTEPNFGVLRTINEADGSFVPENNVLYGTLKIKNIGKGWVDYIGQSADSELGLYKIKTINVTLDPESKLNIYSVGELTASFLAPQYKNGCEPVINGLHNKLVLTSGCTNLGNTRFDYLLKLISGEELDLRLGFDPTEYYTEQTYERINYDIESGYCVDLASIDVKLSSK